MDTIFMNSENSKAFKSHVFNLKITDKIDLRIDEKFIGSIYYINSFITLKKLKAHVITINLKYLHPHGMMNLNYQMGRVLYQIFETILNTF